MRFFVVDKITLKAHIKTTMSIALFFIAAALAVAVYVFVKIGDPSSEAQVTRQEFTQSLDPKKEWNIGALLLRIGPVLCGFGLLGLVIQEWWDKLELRLLLIGLIIFTTYSGAFVLSKYFSKSKISKVYAEALLIIGTFLIGAFLQTLNQASVLKIGASIFGIGEITGIWFLVVLPIAYLFRSSWIMGINTIIGLTWFSTYILTPEQKLSLNLASIFNINTADIYVNTGLYYFLLVIGSVISVILHSHHQGKKHFKCLDYRRTFCYLSGLMAFLSVGSLVFQGVVENFIFFQNTQNGLIADAILAVLTLGLFLIDYICKVSVKNYNINFLTPVIVILAGLIGPIIFGVNQIFIGFYFLEVAYIVWLLANFLRHQNHLAQILFYVFNAIELFAISTNAESFNWFKLLVILGIIMYASITHYRNRPLVFYVVFAGVTSLMLKIFSTNASGYLLIFGLGLILMAFGIYYTQTRSKMLAEAAKPKMID